MQHRRRARAGAVLLLLAVTGCGEGKAPQSSSSSHWIRCKTDVDCANLLQNATCSTQGYCVDESSTPIELQTIYESDFAGVGLDPDVFGFETGFGLRNDDEQFYTDRSENAFVENGELVLRARAESYEQAEYTSASLETRGKLAFTFGRVEAQLSLPTGAGVGPGFWMLPDSPASAERSCNEEGACIESSWPVWGDIVIGSLRSEAPTRVLSGASYTTRPVDGGELLQAESFETSGLEPGTYHLLRLDWGPERLDWFVDDALVHSFDLSQAALYRPAGENPFHRAFHVKLTLSVGGLSEPPLAEQYPQELRVRWLRVSQFGAAR